MAIPDFDFTKQCAETTLHNGTERLRCIYVQGHDGSHYVTLPGGHGFGWQHNPSVRCPLCSRTDPHNHTAGPFGMS